MAETIRMCDVNKEIAARVFVMLNGVDVTLELPNSFGSEMKLVTDVEPRNLIYPEGWYYEDGKFTNKRTSTFDVYEEVVMEKVSGNGWNVYADYCTLE